LPDTNHDTHYSLLSMKWAADDPSKILRYWIQILGLIFILAFISGCVTTKGVDVPDFVYPDSSFQAVVTVEIDESETAFGYMCVLVPVGWKRIIYFVANRKVVTWAIMRLSNRL